MSIIGLSIVVFIAVYLWGILISLWLGKEMGHFLRRNSEISSKAVLEEFKKIARRNMYLALVQIPVLGFGLILGVVIIFRYGLAGLLGVIAANVVLLVCGIRLMKLEKQSRTLPAANEELAREHRQVSETWVKKALPNF